MPKKLLTVLLVMACNGDKDTPDTNETIPIEETGLPDTDTGSDTGDTVECTAQVVDVEPINGQTEWYYRDPVTVILDEPLFAEAQVTALANGVEVPVSVQTDDTGLKASVIPEAGAWDGSTTYALSIDLCGAVHESDFTTSLYGAGLSVAASDLTGNTYYVDMSEATYTQPAGVGTIIRQFLTNPLLIDITNASDESLTIIGAQGQIDEVTAEVTQDTRYETWDFGSAAFDTQPYFSATANETTFTYVGQDIPVYDFSFDGTFSPDASTIGGMNFSGLGDTRYMGPLLNLGNSPSATCDLLGSVGVECIPCRDKEVYCVMLVGFFEDAALLPDIDVEIVTK